MASDSVAKGNISFAADGSKLDSGLAAVQKSLDKFRKEANAKLANLSPSFAKNAFSFAAGQAIFSGISGLASSINESLVRSFKEIKKADSLGFSQAFFSGISLQARQLHLDLDEVDRAWVKYQELTGEAMRGNEQAERVFERLGISVADLNSLNAEQVWGRVAEAVNNLSNPLDRAIARIELFGAKGAGLGRVFQGGQAGIEGAVAEARRLGLALSDAQAEAVSRGVKLWVSASARITAAWDGVIRQWAATAAPILEGLAKQLEGIATSDWVKELPRQAALFLADAGQRLVEGLTIVGQFVLEAVKNLVREFKNVQNATSAGGIAGGAGRGFLSLLGFGFANRFLRPATPQTPELNTLQNSLTNFLNGLRAKPWADSLKEWFAQFDAAGTGGGTSSPRSVQTTQAALEFLDTLRQANANFGQSAEEIKREWFARARLNATLLRAIDVEIERRQARELDRQQEEQWNRVREEGVNVFKEMRTPTEQFVDEVKRLQGLLQNEVIQPETFQRGIVQAFKKLGTTDSPSLSAAFRGSAEAAKILAEARRPVESPQEAVRRIVEEQLQIEQAQLGVQQAMFRAILEQTGRLAAIQAIVPANPAPPAPPGPLVQGGQNVQQQPFVPLPPQFRQEGVDGGQNVLQAKAVNALEKLVQIEQSKQSVELEVVE